jgi:hypothetical protein
MRITFKSRNTKLHVGDSIILTNRGKYVLLSLVRSNVPLKFVPNRSIRFNPQECIVNEEAFDTLMACQFAELLAAMEGLDAERVDTLSSECFRFTVSKKPKIVTHRRRAR